MSITPIEMYTMVPKSQEAASTRQAELSKEAGQQAGIVQSIDRSIAQNSQRTVKSGETKDTNPEFRYDTGDRESGNGAALSGRDQRKKKKETEGEDGKQEGGTDSGHVTIDIRI